MPAMPRWTTSWFCARAYDECDLTYSLTHAHLRQIQLPRTLRVELHRSIFRQLVRTVWLAAFSDSSERSKGFSTSFLVTQSRRSIAVRAFAQPRSPRSGDPATSSVRSSFTEFFGIQEGEFAGVLWDFQIDTTPQYSQRQHRGGYLTVSESVAVLLLVLLSVTPLGAVTVPVSETVPFADGSIVPVAR